MIVEDQNMPDSFAPFDDILRHNHKDSPLSSRCCIRQSGGSISHHLFLTTSRDNVSGRFEKSCERGWKRIDAKLLPIRPLDPRNRLLFAVNGPGARELRNERLKTLIV